jgi:hypothetical protein
MQINEPTSFKECVQSMMSEPMAVLRGEVISEKPLEIQVVNDKKMTLHENIMCLPRHLTDYTTTCDIKLGGGTLDSQTNSVEGHSHRLTTFSITGAEIKVYNSLKYGEMVYILSFNKGKKYYILDREA